MLNVIFNDCMSDLSLVIVNGDEEFVIIDSGFKVYGSISASGLEISRADLINLWINAAESYFKKLARNSLLKNGYFSKQKIQSIMNFNQWAFNNLEGDDGE